VLSDSRIINQDGSVKFDKRPVPVEPTEKTTKKSKPGAEQPPVITGYVSRKFYMGPLLEFVRRNLFMKNTRQSITQDYDVPQVFVLLVL